jgi:hypothetical protein
VSVCSVDRGVSGACWHECFSNTLKDMGYVPSKADSDVWMKDMGDHYEYICMYADDIAVVSKDPQAFFDLLTGTYHYKLKGIGEMKYHLGMDIYRDKDGTLVFSAKSYIKRLSDNYELMFGEPSKYANVPLSKGGHPELDLSEELDSKGIRQYQLVLGGLGWAVTLGRFDIHVHVMTMGLFRCASAAMDISTALLVYEG